MIRRGALLGLVCWAVSASLQASTPEPSSQSAKREPSSSPALQPSSPQPPKPLWRLPSEAITVGPWTFSGLYGATFNQTFLRQWNAGGQNSLNTGFILRQSADYARDKWSATHLLDAAYGLNFQEGIVRKIDDKLEYNLRVDHLISGQPMWKLSGFGSLKSQWYKGFAKPGDPDTAYVSRFLAPGYALAGIGLTHKDAFLEFYFSPVTAKYTVVLDPRLQAQGLFGLSPGQALRQEMGAYMNMRFKRNFPNKLAVDLRTNLFGNYLASPFSIDVDADILLVYKATNHLSITLRTQGIFDRDIAVRDSNGDGKVDTPGIQLKQLSGVGLTYNFGSIK